MGQSVKSLAIYFLIDWKGECGTMVKQSPMTGVPVTSTSREHDRGILINSTNPLPI
jgi:hypothetical protein